MPERYPVQPEVKVKMKLPGDGQLGEISHEAQVEATLLTINTTLAEQAKRFEEMCEIIHGHSRWTAISTFLSVTIAVMAALALVLFLR